MNRAQRRKSGKPYPRRVTQHPAALSGLLNDAINLHRTGDLRRAMPLYNDVLSNQPDNHIALHMLGVMACQIGNHQLALDYVDKALSFDPENAAYHNTRSAALRSLDRVDEAVDSCRMAIYKDPGYAEAHFNLGNLLAQRGRVVEATACFETAADLRPAYEAAWFRLGQLRLEQDLLEPALEAFRSPLSRNPNDPDALNNAGNVLMQLGRIEEALESYRKAIDASPDHPQAHYNLGFVLHQRGDLAAAEESYRRALNIDPDFIPALNNLSELLTERGEGTAAVDLLEEPIRKYPDHAGLSFNLACALRISQDNDRAEKVCREILRRHPDHESALHLLNTINGYTPELVPTGYVRNLFDNCSERFERRLVSELGYTGPALLRQDLQRCAGAQCRFGRAIDLGCGSGLAGVEFRPLVDSIDGVDLSSRMAEVARRKHVYASVFADNISDYLSSTDGRYDLFVAADVLVYMGNLDTLFDQIVARAGGECWFVFTIEDWDGDGFKLQPSGRIAHSDSYISGLADAKGFEVMSNHQIDLRREAGAWITGRAYVLRLNRSHRG